MAKARKAVRRSPDQHEFSFEVLEDPPKGPIPTPDTSPTEPSPNPLFGDTYL